MSDTKEAYQTHQKKYSLPNYSDLNLIFNLEDIDSDSELFLANVRGKIHDKFDNYARLIENIMQPDSNIINLYEAHYVSDKQKNNAYSLLKKLMLCIRNSELISIENNEDDNAKFIKDSYAVWLDIKEDIKKHITKIKETWEKDTGIKEDFSYFG